LDNLKVSIITVCFNSDKTIEDTLQSVSAQNYSNIEYIVIDGGSKDSTNELISKYSSTVSIHISERDAGLYDAMNKGISLASGDIIGILNSDDVFFNDSVIQDVVNTLGSSDGVYADVGFYDQNLQNKSRHYSSAGFVKHKFARGFMPAHPSCYLKKEVYERVGRYDLQYKIASDYDLLLRVFHLPNTSYTYLPQELVKMRVGGLSTSGLMSNYTLNKEILMSCKLNGIKASWLSILSKYPSKIMGFLFK
jgi:glycosyltransferase involved in cell wall biosynthesis